MFKSERQAKNKLKLLHPVAGSQKTQEDRRKKKQQPASRTDRKRARKRERLLSSELPTSLSLPLASSSSSLPCSLPLFSPWSLSVLRLSLLFLPPTFPQLTCARTPTSVSKAAPSRFPPPQLAAPRGLLAPLQFQFHFSLSERRAGGGVGERERGLKADPLI